MSRSNFDRDLASSVLLKGCCFADESGVLEAVIKRGAKKIMPKKSLIGSIKNPIVFLAALLLCAVPMLSFISTPDERQVVTAANSGLRAPVQESNSPQPPTSQSSLLRFPAGTVLQVRLLESIEQDSATEFDAELAYSLLQQEKIVFPKGTRLRGHAAFTKREGSPAYTGFLSLLLDGIQTIDGRWIEIKTTPVLTKTKGNRKRPHGQASSADPNSSDAKAAASFTSARNEAAFPAGRKVTFALKQELTVPQ
jgi:hypothetical protein